MRRRFICSEAEYLTAQGVDLKLAVQYEPRYGPAAVRALVQAGVSPEVANAIEGEHGFDIAARLRQG